MPRDGYLQAKVEKELEDEIRRAADEDERKLTDEMRYLLKLGLKARRIAKHAEIQGIQQAGMSEARFEEEDQPTYKAVEH